MDWQDDPIPKTPGHQEVRRMLWRQPGPSTPSKPDRWDHWLRRLVPMVALGCLWLIAWDVLDQGMPGLLGGALAVGLGIGCWMNEKGTR